MTDRLRHRGPDDEGVWIDPESGIGLGHRRLAIVELSPAGHQPMHSACGRYVLAFNGEIYNHLDIRAELQAAGFALAWRGQSDTETLLAAIRAWGLPRTLERAAGMFALAVWDREKRVLQLSRDRFGEKPLYYGRAGGDFIFGSELKALRAYPAFQGSVNRDALALYLQFGAVPAPYSIYQGVCKLKPGCIVSVSHDSTERIEEYWSAATAAKAGLRNPFVDEREALEDLESCLTRAVAIQSVADVPLGAFLSGGVDSSTIVALMQAQASRPVRTFTIGFDEQGFDESAYALAVAAHLGTEHHEMRVSPQDALNLIPYLPELYDEPFGDSSQIPTHLVCKSARAQVTVALSGDAGDELFGGYNRYLWGQRIWRHVGWVPFGVRRALGATVTSIPPGVWDGIAQKVRFTSRLQRVGDKAHKLAHRLRTVKGGDDLYRSLVTEWPTHASPVLGARALPTVLDDSMLVAGIAEPEQRMMLLDAVSYLPDDILTKVDRAAMGVSLETRAPFLDHRLFEMAWRLPLDMKIRSGQSKWALRQILYKHVPRALIERPKAGFAIPIGDWLRGPLRGWAEDLIDPSRLEQQGYLDARVIRRLWAQHLSGQHDWTARLWYVLMFQAWLEKNP